MTEDPAPRPQGRHARGAVLYGGAAALLIAGGVWWVRAAPDLGPDPRFAVWHAKAEQLLPDDADLAASGTLDLAAGTDRMVESDVPTGFYRIAVVCLGEQGSAVQVSISEREDAAREVSCAEGVAPTSFSAGAGTLTLHLEVNSAGPVVVRYVIGRLRR